ncbi:dienelactone hydrolase [Gordonia sp. TBRC 11910]|uniref:Dienelactone hydrolase n=1 Tax=Gordonia asplenii TaxID=2725283 RepID=A0A848KSA0_9ACTN|nr:dienelactone hydrolase family protein [Gordonia asplenii]NMO01142.1 dienelactone hydrolase [Gordonia asplenii]
MSATIDPLDDFTRGSFTHDNVTHRTYTKGTGPAVIVMAEVPGITPRVADFARRVADRGMTVVMPSLFGEDGLDPVVTRRDEIPGVATAMTKFVGRLCVSREFTKLATGKSSPVVTWLRALAADSHERFGGPGVGAVGMCFTGGFALAMSVDDRMLAPVLSQPSLPFRPIGDAHCIDISPRDLETVKTRCAAGLQVMGLRFQGDKLSPAGRFDYLREQLGDAFIGVELPDTAANPEALLPPHSVLTEHLIDEPGQPTHDTLLEVLDFFATKLAVQPAG